MSNGKPVHVEFDLDVDEEVWREYWGTPDDVSLSDDVNRRISGEAREWLREEGLTTTRSVETTKGV